MTTYRELYRKWLDSPALSEAEWRELAAIGEDDREIESRFYAPLSFGTAGLRGVMGVGLNRMNIHVIRHATQAFASVVAEEGPAAREAGVVICYDCRENSELFAREAAAVMAGNGVRVLLFEALRPTPELSFAVRHYKATAGINITASHNPREYNGYKVYWSDGAQLPPRHADAVAEKMKETDIFTGPVCMDFDQAVTEGMIRYLGAETDEKFLDKVLSQAIDPDTVRAAADRFRVVYTPFHGTGYRLVPEALRRLGLTQLYPVPEQMVVDGSFPTVKSPNPENPEGFRLAIALAEKADSDLIIGTDPDADRVAVMVRREGAYIPVSGNQLGVLLLDYIIRARLSKAAMPAKPAAIKTIVSTAMAREVAERNGVHMDETFTGFKFMAEKLAEYEAQDSYEYLMAFEESCGYMMGDYVRDKDAVTASLMITEMAASYFLQGKTLLDALDGLYAQYGYFGEQTLNLMMPGVDGREKMQALMQRLREDPPHDIAGGAVIRMRDYEAGEIRVPGLGAVGETEISGSNVLYFELEDGSTFIVRPSGTEPKIKVYLLVRGSDDTDRDAKLSRYAGFARTLAE